MSFNPNPPAEARRIERALLDRQVDAWVRRWPEAERARLKNRDFCARYAAPVCLDTSRAPWRDVAWQDATRDATRNAASAVWGECYTDEEVKS